MNNEKKEQNKTVVTASGFMPRPQFLENQEVVCWLKNNINRELG